MTPRGLTTSPIPYDGRAFQIDFDFIDHALVIGTSDGEAALAARCRAGCRLLRPADGRRSPGSTSGFGSTAAPTSSPTRSRSRGPRSTPPTTRIMRTASGVCSLRRTGCSSSSARDSSARSARSTSSGAASIIAVTRFSGRKAPPHPGGIPSLPDAVTREAYSHEVSSAGFWPGGGAIDYPAFYSYAYPDAGRVSPRRRSGRARRFSIRRWASSSCPMMPSGAPMRRTRCCWIFCSRPMRLRPTRQAGIVPRWNARRAVPGCPGRSLERCASASAVAARLSSGRPATVACISMTLPSRRTRRVSVRPIVSRPSSLWTASTEGVGSPSTEQDQIAGCRPAAAAGPPSVMLAIRTPAGTASPSRRPSRRSNGCVCPASPR